MSRYLGVDYGTLRIGLAVSDALGLTAQPLEVVARKDLTEALRRVAQEYDIERVVVGLPTSLGGHESDSAFGARELGTQIASLLGVEVDYVDERFTSRMAEGALLESGMRRKDRKATVDKVAAAIILQTYLDTRRPSGNPTPEDGVEPTDIP